MLKLITQIKEMMMEKIEKKHIKKIKPQAKRPSCMDIGSNGGSPCPPVGG